MAEFNVKTEFKSSPSPEARLASPQVDYPLSDDEKKPANVTPELSPPKATWKHCKKFDPLIQVETKEKAVGDAERHLTEIDRSLRRHSSEVPSASKWVERINFLRTEKKECRVLIGFLGVTGAGKSSMINALLEHEDLLPADDEKACTAVCVEIMWNGLENPAQAFQARIDRISADDWRIELEKLFQDISDQAQNKDGEDGEPDLERDMRIKTAFQKLKCVYPHIRSYQDLNNLKVKELLEHPNVKNILGQSKSISSGSLEEFASAIKPYIDSSTSKEGSGKSFAQWPLVKLVRLSIKSRILMDGIILVDLPGSMDTNTSRSAVAENYQKNLTVTCVVAPTARAASDKPAQDLLGKITQRNLQLDNRFSADHLCFIVSKTDSSLNVARYIKTHPNLVATLAPEFESQRNMNELYTIAIQKRIDAEQKQQLNQQLYETLTREYKNQVAAMKKANSDAASSQNKRKRNEDDHPPGPGRPPVNDDQKSMKEKLKVLQSKMKETKSKSDDDGNRLYKIHRKIKEIESSLIQKESKKTAACITNRNKVSTKEIRQDFEAAAKQMGRKGESKPLQVFCVSSWGFAGFMKGAEPLPGFRKLSETGIPNLQKWLIETTLETRDRNAVSFLENIVSLELSMSPWLADTSDEYKMPLSQRDVVEDMFDRKFQDLVKNMKNTASNIVRKCEDAVTTQLFSKMPKIEHTAANEAERVVKSWAQKPMHWACHRAINRGQGEWKTNKGVAYKWNDELAGIYLDLIVSQWHRTIHSRLPEIRNTYDSSIAKLIKSFIGIVVDSVTEICPELFDALQQWQESSNRTVGPIQKHSQTVFDENIQGAAREAHRLIKPKIKDSWNPIYDQCGAESGPGHFRRNQITHAEHVKSAAAPMYRKGSTAIRAAFKKLWDSLPSIFNEGTKSASTQIKEEFEFMLNNHTLSGELEMTRDGGGLSKAKLQQEIHDQFNAMKLAWAQEIEVEMVEEEDEPEEKVINLDDLDEADNDDDLDYDPDADVEEDE